MYAMALLCSVALASTASAQPLTPYCTPLPLEDVRLTAGPLKQAQDKDAEYLLQLEPDRMLAFLRKRAGLEPKAKGYDGWDGDGRNLTGHICGHYLSAVSIMYAATGDSRFKERVAYIVDQLEEVQQKNGNGYLGALEGGQEMFAQVAKGDIRSGGFDLNGQWAPFYTLHKMYAGLRDAYRFAGNKKALQLEIGFSAWCENILKDLNDEQIQKMLNTEFGGMNEVFADLYADTKDDRWLKMSYKFEHHLIIDPLKSRKDELAGKHGNTQIPKVLGSLARSLATGNEEDYKVAYNFWDLVVSNHTYATGGHGKDEYFGDPDKLSDRVDGRTCETCNVYNMLKLTRRLFAFMPDDAYAGYQERALYNHILSSISLKTGQTCYMVPVGRGVQREYGDMFHSFTCCVGSGMESHALHGDGIYYVTTNGMIFVTLFADSKATWKANGVTVEQKTDFPLGENVQFIFKMEKPIDFVFLFPKPKWVGDGFTVKVNRQLGTSTQKFGWVHLNRTWKNGDVVDVLLPKTLRLEATPDNPNRAAILWGPLVLAGDLGEENKFESWKPNAVPVIDTEKKNDVASWLKPVKGETLGTFRTEGVGQNKDVTFKPFYLLPHRTYGIYWDFFTHREWLEREEQYVAEQKRLARLVAATVGFAQPGEMQPERDYNQQGEETWADRVAGRACRRGKKWFSFDLPVDEKDPMTLTVTYYKDEWRKRTFTISADGVKLGEQIIPGREGLKFFDVNYSLPPDLVKGKTKVTIRFEATGGNEIGAVFGLRTYRSNKME